MRSSTFENSASILSSNFELRTSYGARNRLSYPVISTYPLPLTELLSNEPDTSTAPSQYVTPVEPRVTSSWSRISGLSISSTWNDGSVIRQPIGYVAPLAFEVQC